MKSSIDHHPMAKLLDNYCETVMEAYRLAGFDKKEAKKMYAKAGLIALKINALRFSN